MPRHGRARVTTRGQDRYIMNTHLRNLFQTAIATAANTPGLHNNRISAQTVRNRLWENGLHARRPYAGCVLTQHQIIPHNLISQCTTSHHTTPPHITVYHITSYHTTS